MRDPMLDLKQHLVRQMAFSHATFGPGKRTAGVIDHIKEELDEVENATDHDERVKEWTDVVILALDGLTRELAFTVYGTRVDPKLVAELAVQYIEGKQAKNEARNWPNWRDAPTDKAIKHVIGADE